MGKPTSNELLWSDETLMRNVLSKPEAGYFEFDGDITIAKLEQIMEQDFGVYIQVFRKYGDAWLQTTSTDQWTLNKAEEMAEELKTIKH